jgi:hypothetical protein
VGVIMKPHFIPEIRAEKIVLSFLPTSIFIDKKKLPRYLAVSFISISFDGSADPNLLNPFSEASLLRHFSSLLKNSLSCHCERSEAI